jgi:peptidoglycan hydrolase-like protein with peptidoglycan-binding domain
MRVHAKVPVRTRTATRRTKTPASSGDDHLPPMFATLLQLQRTAGNAAVSRALATRSLPLQRCGPGSSCGCSDEEREAKREATPQSLQRQAADLREDSATGPATSSPGADGHDLRAARFAGQTLLEATFDDRARVRAGSDPEAVTRTQQALVDVEPLTGKHYDLGTSGPGHNGVDGSYGPKTSAAVRTFKADESLGSVQFGDIGPGTMARLDELFAGKGGGGGGGKTVCADGAVSLEADPIPDVPPPKITFLSAPDLLDLVRKRQTPGAFVPSRPPLGATVPKIENVVAIKTRTVPDGDGCLRCVAEWTLPTPSVEVFIATGSFSDEKRFWVTQPGDARECITPVPTLKEVRKLIKPGAIPKIIEAEMEHVADFRRAYRIAIHRSSANVGRLSEARTHLRAKTDSESTDKVTNFLSAQGGLPVALPLDLLTRLFVTDVLNLHEQSNKRDVSDHVAVSKPPAEQPPIRPTIDLDRNPFGCSAFFRSFDENCTPRVPGPSTEQIVLDTNDPPKRRWHSL